MGVGGINEGRGCDGEGRGSDGEEGGGRGGVGLRQGGRRGTGRGGGTGRRRGTGAERRGLGEEGGTGLGGGLQGRLSYCFGGKIEGQNRCTQLGIDGRPDRPFRAPPQDWLESRCPSN